MTRVNHTGFLFFFFLLCFLYPNRTILLGQTSFHYRLSIDTISFPGIRGIHSFSSATAGDKWLIIGGRTDGIHARQPFNAFLREDHNDSIYVVDPVLRRTWSSPLDKLEPALFDQLISSNAQFYQEGDRLILAGGYGYSQAREDHITHPYLLVIEVQGLVEAVMDGQPVNPFFRQVEDPYFAVTGGAMGKIDDRYFIAGGHRFDGRYNPMNHPTFVQEYTNSIRFFRLTSADRHWSVEGREEWKHPIHLHRRDYNLLPQVFPDGSEGYMMSAGVFQYNADIPWPYTVNIASAGISPVPEFNQYLSSYHSACVPLFSANDKAMHNIFFGGISRYYPSDTGFVDDIDVPFVKTVSLLSRDSTGQMSEYILPFEMPAYLGAGATFLINPALDTSSRGIAYLDLVDEGELLLGYILGGIESLARNPFTFNNHQSTFSSGKIYRVTISPDTSVTHAQAPVANYHNFRLEAALSDSTENAIILSLDAIEAGKLEIILSDRNRGVFLNEVLELPEQGPLSFEIAPGEHIQSPVEVTAILNGRYLATQQLIFKR